eukprot:362975-Chlamydomonas_euryale.AAC.3
MAKCGPRVWTSLRANASLPPASVTSACDRLLRRRRGTTPKHNTQNPLHVFETRLRRTGQAACVSGKRTTAAAAVDTGTMWVGQEAAVPHCWYRGAQMTCCIAWRSNEMQRIALRGGMHMQDAAHSPAHRQPVVSPAVPRFPRNAAACSARGGEGLSLSCSTGRGTGAKAFRMPAWEGVSARLTGTADREVPCASSGRADPEQGIPTRLAAPSRRRARPTFSIIGTKTERCAERLAALRVLAMPQVQATQSCPTACKFLCGSLVGEGAGLTPAAGSGLACPHCASGRDEVCWHGPEARVLATNARSPAAAACGSAARWPSLHATVGSGLMGFCVALRIGMPPRDECPAGRGQGESIRLGPEAIAWQSMHACCCMAACHPCSMPLLPSHAQPHAMKTGTFTSSLYTSRPFPNLFNSPPLQHP